jgi:hypothetical protein
MFTSIRGWLNLKVVLGGIIFAVCVFAILLGVLWSARAQNTRTAPSTALLSVIEVPTITPPMPVSTPTPSQTPTSEQQEPIPMGDIKIGDYVQVTGTGGDGLRLHETAGVAGKVNYVATDAQVFKVKDGPIDADGYVWWELQDPYTDDVVGWGVANYLAVVQNP